MKAEDAEVRVSIEKGRLAGKNVIRSTKKLGQLNDVFADEAALSAMDANQIAYEVEMHQAVPDGTEGGLLFGTSRVYPGVVGREYFMTRGHFHARRNTAEYYWGLEGNGLLLMMNERGECRAERVEPGSLHYIPGNIAHRLINTGNTVLSVGACWPSDAGHDYAAIDRQGFTVRVMRGEDGGPVFVTGGKRREHVSD